MVSRSSLLPRHNQHVMCEGETDRTVDFTSGCHSELKFIFVKWVLRDIDECVITWGEHLRSKVRLQAVGHMGCTDPSSMYITICRHEEMKPWRNKPPPLSIILVFCLQGVLGEGGKLLLHYFYFIFGNCWILPNTKILIFYCLF